MIKASKIAISLPAEDLRKLEIVRKKSGLQRSAIIDQAIRFWLRHLEENEKVRQYEQGYARKPEAIDEIKALHQLSADAFKEEGLV
ncbi:MAG: hypothetical protein HZA29_04010 [Candidatus Omnitrophica bacterium]|nr:hypothetical protein [Candidatus Omnitrophota bacterium]